MRTFLIVWLGQLVSVLGSKLSEFALGFWILEQTYKDSGNITEFAVVILLIYLPKVIVSPFAGVLIDRWNRRSSMILSDAATGLISIIIILLVFTQQLQVWHIYVAITISSSFGALQLPAYQAAIAQIVPPQNISRANGMVQASIGIAKIASPFIAGLLMKFVGLLGVLGIDLITFTIALLSLAIVRFPDVRRDRSKRKRSKKSSVKKFATDTILGWKYISTKPGLLRLLLFVAVSYFTTGMLEVILWPLLYEPDSTGQLGSILTIGGCGVLVGSLIMSIWGVNKNRVLVIVGCVALQGAVIVAAGLQASLIILGLGIFLYLFAQPIIISSNQAIWQNKIPARIQGRVFALQQSLERILAVCGYIFAGPLVDRILNPLMRLDHPFIGQINQIIGGEAVQERGIALLLILLGALNLILVAIALREPKLIQLEKNLPDRNQFDKSNLDFSEINSNQSLS